MSVASEVQRELWGVFTRPIDLERVLDGYQRIEQLIDWNTLN